MSTLGDRVLDWMLRRLEQGAPVHSDLVLVHTDQALADVPPSISHGASTGGSLAWVANSAFVTSSRMPPA